MGRRDKQRGEDGKLRFVPGEHIEDGFDSSRVPKNKAEAMFCQFANERGWLTTKRGWPDFFCVNGDEICCV